LCQKVGPAMAGPIGPVPPALNNRKMKMKRKPELSCTARHGGGHVLFARL